VRVGGVSKKGFGFFSRWVLIWWFLLREFFFAL